MKPSLKKFVAEGERVWNLLTPNNRKLYHALLETKNLPQNLNGWKKFLADYWEHTPAGMFENHVQTGNVAIKEGYRRACDSDKNNEKAMKMVEEADEAEANPRRK